MYAEVVVDVPFRRRGAKNVPEGDLEASSSDWETVPVTTPIWNLAPVPSSTGAFLQPVNRTATSMNASNIVSSFFTLSSSSKELALVQPEDICSTVTAFFKVS